MCPGTCKSIYFYCKEDFFKFDDKNQNSLIFCEKNAVFCSKLRDIFEVPEDFCKSLGFEINNNENYEEFLDAILSNSTYSPICYNGYSSSKVFGTSTRGLVTKKEDKFARVIQAFSGGMLLTLLYLLFLSS